MIEATLPRQALNEVTSEALGQLLLTLADDDFVVGYWDSEWTGIAPMLEEDVAFSSLAQDEIGHARAYYTLLGELRGDDAERIAYGRPADAYRHARVFDHPRTDWAFSLVRRWLYDTADAVRLRALVGSSYRPLGELVAKIQREERYHLMHLHAWLRRLAEDGGEARQRLEGALERLAPDALTVFAPLPGEEALLAAGILTEPTAGLAARWTAEVDPILAEHRLPPLPGGAPPIDGRVGHGGEWPWLWHELTSVYRSDPEAAW